MALILWLLGLAALSYIWARFSLRHVKVGGTALVHEGGRHVQKKGRIVFYKHGTKHYSSKFSSSSSE